MQQERTGASGVASCLYVIWSKGRHQEARILEDLGSRFEIRQVFEVEWSGKYAVDNFQRFYGDIDVRGI